MYFLSRTQGLLDFCNKSRGARRHMVNAIHNATRHVFPVTLATVFPGHQTRRCDGLRCLVVIKYPTDIFSTPHSFILRHSMCCRPLNAGNPVSFMLICSCYFFSGPK